MNAGDFFASKLQFQTDPADLAQMRASSPPLIIDVRSEHGWEQGRIPGAVHIPLPELTDRIADHAADHSAEIVTYCWGPGCNGSTRAALLLSEKGYANVRELIGGYEYWAREGFAVVRGSSRFRNQPDPLTAPLL